MIEIKTMKWIKRIYLGVKGVEYKKITDSSPTIDKLNRKIDHLSEMLGTRHVLAFAVAASHVKLSWEKHPSPLYL